MFLHDLLKQKILINQSTIELTNCEIETLAVGLNFIPTTPILLETEQETFKRAKERHMRGIDLTLYFDDSKNAGFGPIKRGYLRKYVKSSWDPPKAGWHTREKVGRLINNFITNIPLNHSNEKPSTHTDIIKAIETLAKNDKIHILNADKGGAVVVWATEEYDREALRQLSDRNCYNEITANEHNNNLKAVCEERDAIAESLRRCKYITQDEFNAITSQEASGSKIYFLPKIHKKMNAESKTFAGRPIVATHSCAVHLIDKYITELTAPLMAQIPGSLRDTTDLINKLPESVPVGCLLLTADVDSLYPSIPWEEGITAASNFYSNHRLDLASRAKEKNLLPPPSVNLFRRMLRLVLQNSYINFKNKRYFHQIKGTAMGMCISVYFANCYMHAITAHIIENPPAFVISFYRFIDDIMFILAPHTVEEFENLIKSITNAHIHLTIENKSISVPMLDIKITITKENNLVISPYAKPTAAGLYLHPGSCHPKHVINSIPFAQLLRLRRNSSTREIYDVHAKAMIRDFKRIEYPMKMVLRHHHKVRKCNRKKLLEVKEKITYAADGLMLVLPYSPTLDWIQIKRKLKNIHLEINSLYDNSPLEHKTPCLIASNRRTIGSRLTKNIKNPSEI